MFTHYCFVFSSLVSVFIFLAVNRNDKEVLRKIVGTIFIVSVAYFFSYEYPVGSINNTALALFIPSACCALMLLLAISWKLKTPGIKVIGVLSVISIVVQILSLIVVFGFPWIKSTFMVDNAEAVVFTLKASKSGAWNVVLTSFSQEVLKYSFVGLCVGFALLGFVLCIYKEKYFTSKKNILKGVFWGNLFFLCVMFFLAILSLPVLGKHCLDIYRVYTKDDTFVRSDLYEKYYVSTDSVKIESAKNPQNLIYIMLESMGEEHIVSLPELKKLQMENQSFSPGGESIATQGWTIGSQIAKYCAVPLKFPVYDSIQVFLPNVTCIQDLLDSFNYRQLYIQGTDKAFLSFGHFLETHSNIEMHDFSYYTKEKRVERQTSSWGIDDYTLFELMKQDLAKISEEGKPFALYAMTMDTHWPMGNVSEKCNVGKNDLNDKSGTYKRALLCASKYVDEFVNWAKKQEWYDNTLIVIQGDHMIPGVLRELLNMPATDSNYWYNVFVNAPKVDNLNRKFSGFDMFPTIIEMMGMNIDGHRLALGTSLLSDEPTLLELLGNHYLDSLLNLRDEMDLYFSGMKN